MFRPETSAGSRRKSIARVAALGAAVAVILGGAGIAVAQTNAFAATTAAGMGGNAVNAATDTHTVSVGGTVLSQNTAYGLAADTQYFAISKFVDATTGAAVSPWSGKLFTSRSNGSADYAVALPVGADLAGKNVVVYDYIFPVNSYNGTEALPTSIKAGYSAVAIRENLTDASKAITVAADTAAAATTAAASTATATGTSATVNAATIDTQPTTEPGSGGAAVTLDTLATDKADNDKIVASGGVIKDVVNYTGLNPGGIYVIHTTLWNKTDNVATPYTAAKIIMPDAANGSVTIEVPVPAGLEGKDLVVFQTLYNGSDVVVGKHLDKVELRDGTTYLVAHRDPADSDQTVKVFQPVQPCTISGYIWKDANNNGVMDSGEEKVPNVTADLRSIPDNVFPGTLLKSTTTDANGFYKFEVPGDQCGRFFVDWNESQFPDTWKGFTGGDSDLSAPNLNAGWSNPFNVVPGQNVERIDAGLRVPPTGTTIVGNFCAEAQFGGYIADLYNENTGQWDRSVVLQNGSKAFEITGIPAGRYHIRFSKWDMHGTSYTFQQAQGIANVYSAFDNHDDWAWHNYSNTYAFDISGAAVTLPITACGFWESPIVLDLNGNGKIDTSSAASQGDAAFDLFNTGSPVKSGWVTGGDGLLVTPNADGSISNGANLFGGSLGDGFAKLATFDANCDGQVSGAELDGIKVWVDANSDHIAQAGEIKSLAAYGITALNVAYVNAPVTDNGNVVVEHGTAVKADGSTVLMGDAYFKLGALDLVNTQAAGAAAAASQATLAELPAAEAARIREAFATAGQ